MAYNACVNDILVTDGLKDVGHLDQQTQTIKLLLANEQQN